MTPGALVLCGAAVVLAGCASSTSAATGTVVQPPPESLTVATNVYGPYSFAGNDYTVDYSGIAAACSLSLVAVNNGQQVPIMIPTGTAAGVVHLRIASGNYRLEVAGTAPCTGEVGFTRSS